MVKYARVLTYSCNALLVLYLVFCLNCNCVALNQLRTADSVCKYKYMCVFSYIHLVFTDAGK